MLREPLLVSAPATVRLDPPPPALVVEIDVSVIGERAGRRHRGPVFELERRSGADRSEPRQSAVRPQRRAVLDEGVVSVEVNCALAARLVICPLANSIALSPERSTLPLRTPAVPNPALPGHVEERLVGAGAGRDRSSPYYRATPPSPCPTPRAWRCRWRECRCWSAPPPGSGSIRRRRRRRRDGRVRH